MRPLAQSDRHDPPGLIGELVPGVTAMVDDVVVGFEDAVRQPVVAHELPDVLDRVQLRASGRKRQQCDVGWDDQVTRTVPSGLVEQDDGMRTRRDMEGDLFQMHAHRFAVAAGHDDAGGFPLGRADGTEDPGRGAALVLRCGRPGAASGPAPSELGLLTDTRLVLPPQLYRRTARERPSDRCQAVGEVFLKTAMSSAFCPQ